MEISTFSAPAEAHARIAYALAEVRRFLVPVSLVITMFLIGNMFFMRFFDNFQLTYVPIIFTTYRKKGPRPRWTIYKNELNKNKRCLSVSIFGILSVVCRM